MEHRQCTLMAAAVPIALLLVLIPSGIAAAHEHHKVGPIEMTVGWGDEPPFVGFKNSVQLILTTAKKPVLDLGDTLKVEVIFGTEKMGPVPLEAAFDLEEKFGRPGDYRAQILPTRPGTYTFHFIGSIKHQKVDQSFTCSEKTFDCVQDASEIEFPVKDPSRSELAGRIERLGPRIETVQIATGESKDAATNARTLALVGIILGAAAVVVSFVRGHRA